ncbi:MULTISPECIES: phage portal protein [unclassified Bradyrhizobium]|uniref:phage portal protein n=1 Tax=unclassified Bradyrhizobium TaxID=2631580 RepID=UPI00211EE68D|nr:MULTISPECIES: phage portal protein [unclassified Bradyrhizobium]MDD1533055.1 phage portal protein [Bradyrhizobium sp. WBOS8]MDD1582709.1 phage portal protein [Bradyrhizobium sp. WBOS4]UUO48422.1 phage portal protein [Bradyrhizobium sp. WBOS04]UUO62043.1 phage portal protein [Bradyrhizobium sp. WBOS08]
MSIASRLKSILGIETKAAPSLADGSGFYFDLFGATPTLAGVAVTPYSAMTCAPVACAVRSISEPAGSLPLHIYRRLVDGGKEKATDHPLYSLLHDAPNSFAPAALFRTQLMADALLQPHGAFALVNRVDGGKAAELIRLDPRTTPVAVDDGDVEPTYKVDGREIAGADLIHIPSPAYDQRKGLVGEGREVIALAIVLERHAARLFGNGARPSGVLSLKGTITPDALGKAKAAWQAAHSGSNSGGTAVLPSDASWQALTFNSVDSQFLEMRTYAVAEIARLFRVPLHMLMQVDRAQPRSTESIGQEFLSQALLPRLKAFEQELELKLLTPEERDQYCIEFNVDGFARADLLTRAQAMSTAVSSRVLNPNEARQMGFGLPAYEGGDVFENFNTSSAHAGGKLNSNTNEQEAA